MKVLAEIADDFLSLLFPRVCYGCGNHLVRNEEVICTECRILIPMTDFHLTPGNPVEQLFWGRCFINRATAYSFYNRGSRIRKLIHALKYNNIQEIGTELGKMLGTSLKASDFLNGIDLIIPVPLHPSKERKRGYNQALIICEGIASVTGLQICSDVLVREIKTQTQTRRSRYERWRNVEGIFVTMKPEVLENKNILIVDDVITTGSTIESCVNELNRIKGVKVSVAALAFSVM